MNKKPIKYKENLIIFNSLDQVIPNTIANTKVILASQRRHSALQQKHFTEIIPDVFRRSHLLKKLDKMQPTICGSKKITPRYTGFRNHQMSKQQNMMRLSLKSPCFSMIWYIPRKHR